MLIVFLVLRLSSFACGLIIISKRECFTFSGQFLTTEISLRRKTVFTKQKSRAASEQLIAKTQMVEWCWRAGSIRFTIYTVEHFFSPGGAKTAEEFVIAGMVEGRREFLSFLRHKHSPALIGRVPVKNDNQQSAPAMT